MMKAVPEDHFQRLRYALRSARLNWYAIDQDGHALRATDQIIDAAFEELVWHQDPTAPTHVFVLGDPQDVTYDEIISEQTERTAFYKFCDDLGVIFIFNFDETPLDGVEIEDVDWYVGK